MDRRRLLDTGAAFLLAATLAGLGLSGCQAGLQGARVQFNETVSLPSRTVQGANRNPFSMPTVKQALDRLPGDKQVTATLQGIEKDYQSAVAGCE